ncbi:MAG: hypothetical protein KGZ42_04930 [Melioribacter sp.]|nr:hypothetical protein [Melioribacter sp.]
MKPIWYFVGLILLAMGGIIFLTGVYQLLDPPETKTVLSEIHPNVWWGIIMFLFGGLMFLKTRKETV